jgi:hypothetical protein
LCNELIRIRSFGEFHARFVRLNVAAIFFVAYSSIGRAVRANVMPSMANQTSHDVAHPPLLHPCKNPGSNTHTDDITAWWPSFLAA